VSEERARAGRKQLLAGLRAIPRAVCGRAPSPFGDRLRRAVGEKALEMVREAYLARSQGGSADGAPWKALAPATLKAKRAASRRGLPAFAPGFRTGRLYRGLTPGSAECLLEVTADSVRIGTLVPYAEHYDAVRPIWPASWSRREPSRAASRAGGGLADRVEEEMARLVSDAVTRAAMLLAQGGAVDGA
jgi:hypothetical protein